MSLENRLVVTAKRDGLEGHVSVPDRVKLKKLKFQPTYSRDRGGDIKLFICLFLANMPLERVEQVWSTKLGNYNVPKTCCPSPFHRAYSRELHEALGATPSLERWREDFEKFLIKKIPVGEANGFKWKVKQGNACLMTLEEIASVVSQTTYQYALERP